MVINRKGNMDNSWLDDYSDDEDLFRDDPFRDLFGLVNPDISGAKPLDRRTLLELIQKKRSTDLKKPVTCDGNAAHLTKVIKRFEAEHSSLSPIAKRLQDKRTSLLKESAELKTRGAFHPLKREKHGKGGSRIVDLMLNNRRIKYKDKELERATERLEGLNTVINELRVFREELQTQELKSELKDRQELLRLIKIIICLLYALLNRYGRQHHGSQCDSSTIQILLIRSGIEKNPGPRNWKDLPTSFKNLGILSSHICNGWEYYSDRLGVPEKDRDDIIAKYPRVQMQIYHMLKQAARLPQNLNQMLMTLEECTEEFEDMLVTWEMLEYHFADNEERNQLAGRASNEVDGENGSSRRSLKRMFHSESGEPSVKMQRK